MNDGLPARACHIPATFDGKIHVTWTQVLVLPALFGLGMHARHPDDPSRPACGERLDFDARNGTGAVSGGRMP